MDRDERLDELRKRTPEEIEEMRRKVAALVRGRVSLPGQGMAFTAVGNKNGPGFAIALCKEGERGYLPCPLDGTFDTYDDAMDKAEDLNVDLALTRERAREIITSTMD